VTGLELLTLVVALIGALTGVASLVWAVASYLASGVRVKVELNCGWLANGSYVHFDPATATEPDTTGPRDKPIFGVTVRNIGRLPAVVGKASVGTDQMEVTTVNDILSPKVPYELPVSAEATWFFPADQILALLRTAEEAGLSTTTLYASANLGTGRTVRTKGVNARRAFELLVKAG
jgi:hypothetical protein